MSNKTTSGKFPISILICFNIVFAGCSVAIASIGFKILKDTNRQLLFRLVSPESGVIGQIGYALLAIGGFGFLTAVCGCAASARKCSIGWYIFGVSLLLVAEVALGISFLYFINTHGKGVEGSQLTSKLHAAYGIDQPFTQSIDFAQNKFNCCGTQGDTDYDRSTWRNSKLGGSEVVVPWTCCPLNDSVSEIPSYMNPVPINATACQTQINELHTKSHRYKEGCNTPVEEWFRKDALTFLLMGLILFVLQVSALTAAICLCRKVK